MHITLLNAFLSSFPPPFSVPFNLSSLFQFEKLITILTLSEVVMDIGNPHTWEVRQDYREFEANLNYVA